MQRKIKSIYYHNPHPKGFEKIIKWYKALGYRFIDIEELENILLLGKNEEKLAFISLDDGWRGNLNLLPIIEKHNVPITIFVAVEPLHSGNYWWEYIAEDRGGRKMFEFKNLPFGDFTSQLAETKKRISLGRSALAVDELRKLSNHPLLSFHSHSFNHPILTNVPNDVLDMELKKSKEELEDLCHKEVWAFSYPNGSLTEREVLACKSIYRMAFTTEQRHISLYDNPYLLPRIALTGDFLRDLLKIYGIWPIIKNILGKS